VQHGSWGRPAMSSRMAGEYVRVSRGGLAPGAPRPGFSGGSGGVVSSSGRLECNWWGANRQQTTMPRRKQSGEQAAGARAHGEGEPGAGAAGALASRGKRGPEAVELPAHAEPAAQRVVVRPPAHARHDRGSHD
jgi:hypothetical protein